MTSGPRSNLWTVVAIAIVAYAAYDMTHEVLGHGTAAWLVPNDRVLRISTIGLQTSASSRFVAAAGSIVNVIAGLIAWAIARRMRGFGSARWFAWLFGTLNLLDGTGYLLFSGVIDFGDWAVVIRRLEPHLLWRIALVIAGYLLYVTVMRAAAAELATWVRDGELDAAELPRMILPSYLVGGLLMVVASLFNPAGPQYILLSGASGGFLAMIGLLRVPALVRKRVGSETSATSTRLRFSAAWVIAAAIVGGIFVGVLGPGVKVG